MEACTNPDVLKVIFFAKELLDIVFLIVPMGLLLMLGIDFFKNVSAGKEEDMKKNLNIAIKRIIFCVCIFFVPTIVSLLTKIVSDALEDTSINYALCLTNANSDKINELIDEQAQEALAKAKTDKTMANVLEAEDAINKKSDEDEKEEMLEELETIKDEILDESKKTQAEDEEARPSVDTSTSSTTTSSGSSHLDSGTQSTYFAPVQGVTGTFGSESSTAGCANTSVSHDLSGIPSGTPIYAGIDGTAEFKQTYSTQVVSGKKVLTSYGNQVRIIASDGTTIIYGHLLKFADGISAPITETCPKKGTSPPCPADTYQSITTISDTKTVKKGDLIGYLGDTGNSTGPHLHVEIHPQGGRNCVTDPWSAFGMK
jgi:murein DD-endopeptidase MepM/ murein hydrolase activator NlpD